MPKREKGQQSENDILPPSALELAKLAALLMQADAIRHADTRRARPAEWGPNPQSNYGYRLLTRDALLKAVRFYLEAAILYEGLSGLSEENLVSLLLGSDRAIDPLRNLFGDRWLSNSITQYALYKDGIKSTEPNFVKDFKDGLDPARNYLQQHGKIHDWKRCSTVLKAIYKYFEDQARQHNVRNAATIAKFEREVSQIAAEMDVGKDRVLEWRFRDDHRRAWDGEMLCESFLRMTSITDSVSSASTAFRNSQRVIGWALPVEFLKAFVKWRNAQKKRPGGITGSTK